MIPHSRPTIDGKDIEAVAEVIRSGQISQGPMVEEFEKAMSSYVGVKGAVALSSGTSAIHLSLLCLGIREGDEVIIPSYTCSAILNAVMAAGATPRLADIENGTYNIDPNFVESYLRTKRNSAKVKAIILVHAFGQPADIETFLDISKKYNIPVIEDSAQALGATYKERRVGSYGLISILSFYATKVITTGEGGMLLSDMDDILEKARDMREYDKKEDFKLRYNYKMTDMAAALGLSQLKKLPSFLKKREEIALSYNESLKGLFRIASGVGKGERIYYRYIIELPSPQSSPLGESNPPMPPFTKGGVGGLESKKIDRLIYLMEKDGITCRRPIFKPIHHYTGEKGFPNTQLVWERSISIPIYPGLTSEEVQVVTNSLRRLEEMVG